MEILTLGRTGKRPLRIRLLARTAIDRVRLEQTIGAVGRGWFVTGDSGNAGEAYPAVDVMIIEGRGLPDLLERQLVRQASRAGAFVIAVVDEIVTDGKDTWRCAGADRVMHCVSAFASLPSELAAREATALGSSTLVARRRLPSAALAGGLVFEVDARTLGIVGLDGPWETTLGHPRERWLSGPEFWQSLLRDQDRLLALDALHQCRYLRNVRDLRLAMSDIQGLDVVLVGTLSAIGGSGQDPVLRFSLHEIQSNGTSRADRSQTVAFRPRVRIDTGALAGIVIDPAPLDAREMGEGGAATAVPGIEWIPAIAPAVNHFATWRRAGIIPVDVPLVVQLPNLAGASVPALLSLLADHGLAPDVTELGIGWTMLRNDPEAVFALLSLLVEQRIRLSLADVPGTNPELGILWRWPWSTVVLHRDMAADVTRSATLTSMRAMVSIAHTIGIDVVADGVDRVDQLQALRRFACDCAQGAAVGVALLPTQFRDRYLAAGRGSRSPGAA